MYMYLIINKSFTCCTSIMENPKKRKALTLEIKFEIVNEVEKGVSNKTEIAKAYDIPKSTLPGILAKKVTIK